MQSDPDLYLYRAKPVRIIDGDTIDVLIDFGFQLHQKIRLRLLGINTPEIRGSEREAGLRSKHFVEEVLTDCKTILVRTQKAGKYGRYLADIWYKADETDPAIILREGKWLNQELLDRGLAEPYL